MKHDLTPNEIKSRLNDLFPQLEPELIDELSAVAGVKHFKEGEMLMRTGQYFKSTLIIAEGLVKLYRESEEGKEYFIYYIEPGNACALSMVCASRQLSSEVMAVAMKEGLALTIPLADMDRLMKKYTAWYHFVLETYRSRFEELLHVVDAIAFHAMDERLMHYLSKMSKTLNSNKLNLTHQQIADDLNSSREVISRLLKKMEQNGLLVLHRHEIEWNA